MSKRENKKINLIFMGTPEFAAPSLKSLMDDDYFNISAIYTKPDKAQGRGQKISKSPIKILGEEYNIPIYQPEKIKPEIENIKKINPDLIVVIAYGKIIPQEILDIPQYGCINVHGSLLPKYRGSACLNAPILNGDKKTGITIMKMDKNMDTGPILKQFSLDISQQTTLPKLHDDLSKLSSKYLPEVLKNWIEGKIKLQNQDDSQASYVNLINKEDGKINWQEEAGVIERKIRGLNPWPGTFTRNQENKIIKILETQLSHEDDKRLEGVTSDLSNLKPGQVFSLKNQLAIKCQDSFLIINKLQLEGKKAMSSQEFLSGHQDIIGQVLQ